MPTHLTGHEFILTGLPNQPDGSLVTSAINGTFGGTPALAWSAPGGLADGNTLTITTDGTNPFGNVGPNFIFLMDTYNAQGLNLIAATDIEIGAGVTIDSYIDNFELADTDKLGRAIKMGTLTPFATDQNGTTPPGRIWLDFPAHPRMFESRATYWPAANQANAESQLNGTNTWQLKNIWKMADRDYFSTDTDFFVAGEGYNFYNPDPRFKAGDCFLSSNSIAGAYMGGGATNDYTDLYDRPYPDVFFHECLFDQKNYDGTTANNLVQYRSTRTGVGVVNQTSRSDLVMAVPTGATRVINSLSYPGFVRGFSIPDNANFYEADLYFANGDGAACRVVISDHADYFQSTKYAAMKPISWANGQIELKFRTGIFQGDLTGCYINVIGIDNTQIGSIAL